MLNSKNINIIYLNSVFFLRAIIIKFLEPFLKHVSKKVDFLKQNDYIYM